MDVPAAIILESLSLIPFTRGIGLQICTASLEGVHLYIYTLDGCNFGTIIKIRLLIQLIFVVIHIYIFQRSKLS